MAWLAILLPFQILLADDADAIAPNSPTSVIKPASVPPRPKQIDLESLPAAQIGTPQVESPDRNPIRVSAPAKSTKDATNSRSNRDSKGQIELSVGRQLTWWTTTGIGLAVVLSVLFIGSRVIRKVVPGAMVGEVSGPVQLLDRTFLTPKHAACLIKCGDRLLLVGLAGDRMTTLTEIHDQQEIDFIRGQLMQTRPRSTSRAFRDFMSPRAADEAPSDMDDASSMDRPGRSPSRPAQTTHDASHGFSDQLAALRDRISEWKSRAKPT